MFKYVILLSILFLSACGSNKIMVKDCGDADKDGYRICDKVVNTAPHFHGHHV